ncbi:MAG TPA: hypothetical protein VGK34_09045 [Armatimonadota bacterium]
MEFALFASRLNDGIIDPDMKKLLLRGRLSNLPKVAVEASRS